MMLCLRVTYAEASELRRALEQEIAKGVLMVKIPPPEGLQFREPVTLEIASSTSKVAVDSEVLSILPGVGVAVAFPRDRILEVQAIADSMPFGAPGPAEHLIVLDPPSAAAQAAARAPSTNEKIQLALHGTRDDRAAILRDPNKAIHAFVLKSPQVTIEEVTGWAKSAQTSPDFLKQIGERKDWLSRPAIAQALARNPKTPPELAVRALDHVGVEALRQMAKGAGVPPHVVQAARKKVIAK